MVMKITILTFIALIIAASASGQGGHPILKNFVARQLDDQVILQWTIIEGQTCFGIRIERSENDSVFKKIGEISGVCGSPDEDIIFTFTDSLPLENKINYYRLELGSQGYSDPVAVQTVITGDKDYHINNHLATKTLELSFSNEAPKNLRVFNLQAELLTEKQIAGQHVSLPLTGFAGGLYIFQAITESGTTISGTFVVAK
jgi:hypothetical protein